MLERFLPFVRRKPAPKSETKPLPPTPLELALRRLRENIREADERADRVLERLDRESKRAS